METQYQNYKSDFVLRESFLDITHKSVPLPADIDFTLRYWTREEHEYTASRKDGVYTNCAIEGDNLLVFFKEHGLCEGKLHHELHLELDNEAFADGVQNVYYVADINILLWDRSSSGQVLESGLIANYTRGKAFTYADLTDDQKAELQKPAKDAADKYNAALADYQQQASEQVTGFKQQAEQLEQQQEALSEQSAGLIEQMQTATENANNTANDAQEKIAAALTDAQAATKEATEQATAARSAAQSAQSGAQSAETAAQYAGNAGDAAMQAKQQAEQAAADALTAKRETVEATLDANQAAADAVAAGKQATLAIQTVESVTADTRKATEAASAATEKANTAEAAANAAAKEATDQAAAAKNNAERAEQQADAAEQAAEHAATETEKTEGKRAELDELIERAKLVVAGVPTGLRVVVPKQVTIGNSVKQYVKGTVLPVDAAQNILYLSDKKAADILPDGQIIANAEGTSTVHVIPTEGTKYYQSVEINVIKPRIRTVGGGIRLDAAGNIRLT